VARPPRRGGDGGLDEALFADEEGSPAKQVALDMYGNPKIAFGDEKALDDGIHLHRPLQQIVFGRTSCAGGLGEGWRYARRSIDLVDLSSRRSNTSAPFVPIYRVASV
jgi:hypothetical protein